MDESPVDFQITINVIVNVRFRDIAVTALVSAVDAKVDTRNLLIVTRQGFRTNNILYGLKFGVD